MRAARSAAGAFSFVAAIPLTLFGAVSVVKALFGYPSSFGLLDWLLVVLTIFAGYALAALLAGLVFAISRPIRRTFLGSMLVGAVMSPLIYGSMGVCALIMWEPAGRLLFGDHGTTRAEFASEIPVLLVVFAAVGLIAGPWMRAEWRKKRRDG